MHIISRKSGNPEIQQKMENEPLYELTEFYKEAGYGSRDAVERAERELERRHRRTIELQQAVVGEN